MKGPWRVKQTLNQLDNSNKHENIRGDNLKGSWKVELTLNPPNDVSKITLKKGWNKRKLKGSRHEKKSLSNNQEFCIKCRENGNNFSKVNKDRIGRITKEDTNTNGRIIQDE